VDAARFPIASQYLASLPAGEASYPQCVVKGSVLRAIVDSSPIPFPSDELPATLAELVQTPPLPNQWVSEVKFNALMLAHEDLIPSAMFREWVYSRNRKLFSSSLYRILFLVVSPERLLSQMTSRWAAFRRGTELAIVSSASKHFVVDLRYPPFLYDKHVLANVTVAVTAALDAAGGHDPRVRLAEIGETSARFDIRWA
jgi:uncharacterized protein (TIGR02265 family)